MPESTALCVEMMGLRIQITACPPMDSVLSAAFGEAEALSESTANDRPLVSIDIVERADGWSVKCGDLQRRAQTLGLALAHTLELVNRAVARSVVGRTCLHAGAVETSRGVVAFVGRSGAGKSTLTAAAVRSGFGFVADEVTAIDTSSLAVTPYHRPIGLRRGGAKALGRTVPDTPDGRFQLVYPWNVPMGARSCGGVLTLLALVQRSSGEEVVAEVRPAAALAELTEHLVADDDRVVAGFDALDSIVRRVPVVRLRYETPAAGIALVRQIVS